MKVVILAGGYGSRIAEQSQYKPKPMIEIGEQPILWHIMKYYSEYGYDDFIILGGYKQYKIKEYFANYFLHYSDVTFDLSTNEMKVHATNSEKWRVTIVDTGLDTMTGGRLKRIEDYLGSETFMLTYGDGLCNVDLSALERYHRQHGKVATITMANIAQQKGVLEVDNGRINAFREKENGDGVLINGGFMVLEPKIFEYLDGDNTILEGEPMHRLVEDGQLMGFRHDGFWQCMDTQREHESLVKMWNAGSAPWKIWD
ncbi:glucose-1-phosphate cytidylyltransferase [Lachnospiraceae bacterium XBB1006]|nr:glucose-1-phosphate cytidylyltransferase [Lachnospiraceae bacterium XBB1006]